MTHPRLLATLALACAITANMPAAQADMVSGLINFRTYQNGPTDTFHLCSHANNTIPVDDPVNCFLHSYGKSNSFFSLLRFERTIKPISTFLPFDNRLYLVRKGDVITSERLLKGLYPVLNTTGSGPAKRPSIAVGRDFWVVSALTNNVPSMTRGAPFNVFSWAHIRFNILGVPEMIDHITAHNEPGVIVGQKTPCRAQACLDVPAAP